MNSKVIVWTQERKYKRGKDRKRTATTKTNKSTKEKEQLFFVLYKCNVHVQPVKHGLSYNRNTISPAGIACEIIETSTINTQR